MKAAVNQMNSQFGGTSLNSTRAPQFDEHRISGHEFKAQPNMDATNPSGSFHHNKQDLIGTFRKDASNPGLHSNSKLFLSNLAWI